MDVLLDKADRNRLRDELAKVTGSRDAALDQIDAMNRRREAVGGQEVCEAARQWIDRLTDQVQNEDQRGLSVEGVASVLTAVEKLEDALTVARTEVAEQRERAERAEESDAASTKAIDILMDRTDREMKALAAELAEARAALAEARGDVERLNASADAFAQRLDGEPARVAAAVEAAREACLRDILDVVREEYVDAGTVDVVIGTFCKSVNARIRARAALPAPAEAGAGAEGTDSAPDRLSTSDIDKLNRALGGCSLFPPDAQPEVAAAERAVIETALREREAERAVGPSPAEASRLHAYESARSERREAVDALAAARRPR